MVGHVDHGVARQIYSRSRLDATLMDAEKNTKVKKRLCLGPSDANKSRPRARVNDGRHAKTSGMTSDDAYHVLTPVRSMMTQAYKQTGCARPFHQPIIIWLLEAATTRNYSSDSTPSLCRRGSLSYLDPPRPAPVPF